MKYEKCLTCDRLWHRRDNDEKCDGPNFLSLTAVEMGEWCEAKRQLMTNMTIDKIASETGISKSTVYSFLHGHQSDFKLETVRPIIKLLTGGRWGDNPCGNIATAERIEYDARIAELEKQRSELEKNLQQETQWRDDKIEHLMAENTRILEDLSGRVGRHQENQAFLREEVKRKNAVIKSKNGIIITLGICSGVLLLVSISALVMWWIKA